MFDPVDPQQRFPDLEKGILQYWKEEDVFRRSVKHRSEADTFSFYDGPPFATGLPHYGNLLAGTIKDVIPRYQTMRGKRVERRFGWDCHGLPVENLVEKEEGLNGRKDIEEKGARWFNDKCRASVQRYTKEWRKTVERTGRWVDMDFDYRTMDPNYMESIWWVFKELYKKGLIYEGYKSMHVCPRCVTPLSNFEVTLGYKDVPDWTTVSTYPLVDDPSTVLLAWTTTSWTLPGNLFLAVGPEITYTKVKMEGDEKTYIVAESRVEDVFKGKQFEVQGPISDHDLVGKHYEPLFPYFEEVYKKQGAFRIVAGDFVTTEDGTGIVHIATGFGDDDYAVGKREGVEVLSHVGMDGRFITDVSDFAGEEVKPMDDPTKTDKKIAAYLKERGRLFDQGSYMHSYPHCWRCDSPLINYATSSWFVAVEKIKKDLLKANSKTHWVPEHIKDGRFGKWLENARDWAISRNRYWGTPLPIWRADGINSVSPKKREAANPGLKPGATKAPDQPGDQASPFSDQSGDQLVPRGMNSAAGERGGQYPGLKPGATNAPDRHEDHAQDSFLRHGARTPFVFGRLPGCIVGGLRSLVAGGFSRRSGAPSPLPAGFNPQAAHEEIVVIGSRDELMAMCPERFTKVTVMRHGESEGNVKPVYQGEVPGTNLTALGKKQARATAKILRTQRVDLVYASPLARTQQTAQIIAKHAKAKVITDERIREIHFGAYEGKTIDFSDLTFVKDIRAKKIEKGKPESIYHFEGMETWEESQKRIDAFFADILPKHRGQHIVVVSHADPVNNIRHFFTNEDPVKISHQPYPEKARPYTFFWDHDRGAQLDLHSDTVDEIVWQSSGSSQKQCMEITVVRHGETDWNKEGKIQGWKETDMNENGRKQVLDLAHKLKNRQFDCIVCSTLKRASHTAEILSSELGVPIHAQWEGLRERSFGDWEGKRREEISTEVKGQFALQDIEYPNGESFDEFFGRVRKILEQLSHECFGKKVLVVAHGGILKAISVLAGLQSLEEARRTFASNAQMISFRRYPLMRRVPGVLDCWFESGAMPYAQGHYPFEHRSVVGARRRRALWAPQRGSPTHMPGGFPADFIAEGLDQTRGWFYTLMVLSAALFRKPAFRHCVVNGIVLAEDGKKMSKRLKNYPEPDVIMEKYGADAMRFTLMSSPAVRGENLRFSQHHVEETVRRVILPLWNAYSFFVLHANEAQFVMLSEEKLPEGNFSKSKHPLDSWILAEIQDLVNRMTEELDRYDLSATCSELYETLDALTNWYIRRSRRRFAGKEGNAECLEALTTLHEVLLTFSKVLAPFCPFITEAIYLNLADHDHGSIHLTDWPETKALTEAEKSMIEKTHFLRMIVSLGMGLRAQANMKVRQPLARVEIAIPDTRYQIPDTDQHIIAEELNVKSIHFLSDPSHLADRIVHIDARKVGPRLGSKVQEIIKAAKAGSFTENKDGTVTILGETLSTEEAQVAYHGREGQAVASEKGIVVNLDTKITEELKLEGLARDIIRAVQTLRKEGGLKIGDRIVLEAGEGMDAALRHHRKMIEEETNGSFEGDAQGKLHLSVKMHDGEVEVV